MFVDRRDAGRQLAERLRPVLAGHPLTEIRVLGLPRGGAVIAAEVARQLKVPWNVLVVRKLGLPGRPEMAMGAIAEGGVSVLDHDVIRRAGVTKHQLMEAERREQAELERRLSAYGVDRRPLDIEGRIAVIVDDGLATGSTARAACTVARAAGACRVVLAVPVAPRSWTDDLAGVADDFVCVDAPRRFRAVGAFYVDFTPVSDSEVVAALAAR